MNIITIGDLHGKTIWKRINPHEWDYIIFIGDYVDSGEHSAEEVISNLKDILELKQSNPEKVILLWGNHDLAYFYGGHERHYCSGFVREMLPELYNIFTSNRKLFQAACQFSKTLWTHAGVVQRWYENYIKDEIIKEDENLGTSLNRLFNQYYEPLFHASVIRGGINQDSGTYSGPITAKSAKIRLFDIIRLSGTLKPFPAYGLLIDGFRLTQD